jgi:hypothetical protein
MKVSGGNLAGAVAQARTHGRRSGAGQNTGPVHAGGMMGEGSKGDQDPGPKAWALDISRKKYFTLSH